jgi:hypothetical protein
MDYLSCRLWEKKRKDLIYYFGSPSLLYARIQLRKSVQNRDYQILFDDKYLTINYLKGLGVSQPDTFGLLKPNNFNEPYINEVLDKANHEKLLGKPIEGNRGRGVIIIKRRNHTIFIDDGHTENKLVNNKLGEIYLLQEVVEQHESISEIYPNCINTIRLHTLYTKNNDVLILGAYMRFGKGKNIVDNVNAGGLAIGIDHHYGKLHPDAYDLLARKYYEHPDTKFVFNGFEIPHWKDVLKLGENIQKATYFYKFMGMDIAITGKGPVVIEINANPEMAYLEMYTQPLLKDKKVRNEFAAYDLLFNKPQKSLVK